ncbi:MAG: hypothetical protein DRR42_28330, partial [Gammaproteobacteria bacterium]
AGIRQDRTDNTGTTSYIVDANRDYAQVIEEQGPSPVTYTYGLDLLSQDRGTATSYYHYDGLGSTRTLTDNAGNVTDTYVYKAFGTVEAHNGLTDNDYLFAGEQYDNGLAQYYLRARYYDPSKGRFTQMDTFSGTDQDPITLHKYIYANASPGMFVDPSGFFGLASIGAAQNVSAVSMQNAVAGYSGFLFSGSGDELSKRQRGALLLASFSFGSAKIFLMKAYEASNKKNDLTNSTKEKTLLDQRDVIGYYTSRLVRGDAYASLALGVVRNQGYLGFAANAWLYAQVGLLSAEERNSLLSKNGGSYSSFIKVVQNGLANAHSSSVDKDYKGFVGLLSADQISKYHEDYFEGHGLPRNTFGGSVFGFRTEYWCVGCDLVPSTKRFR